MKSTRRGSDSPVHRPEKTPRLQVHLDKWPLSPGTRREACGVPCLDTRRGLTLRSPVCRDPAIGVGNQRYPAVPASTGDEALFQCTKPSGVPRGPSHLQFPWLLTATMRSPLRSPAQVEGIQGFLPQPEKDLKRPSSTRLEARRSEEHTSELQSPLNLVCRLLLEKKKKNPTQPYNNNK